MGLRVLVTIIISFGGIIASFFNAFYGLLTYTFWSYANPEVATWSTIPVGRLSYVVGVVLVMTTLMQRKKLASGHRRNILIIMFWALCLYSVLTFSGSVGKWQFQYFTRVVLITLIITVLVDDIRRFRYYLWAIAIFIGLVAAQSGIKAVLTGAMGGGAGYGYMGLVRGGRNYMAVFLCVVIPIVYYMGNNARILWQKVLLRVIFIGDIFALIITYSRAGFVGIIAVGTFIAFRTKRKILIGIACLLLVFLFLGNVELIEKIIPAQYVDRLKTMQRIDPELEDMDKSAAARILVWRSSLEMIKSNPLMGVGFYRSQSVMEDYPDPVTGMSKPGGAIHNTVLQAAAEVGIPAFLLYLLIFAGSYRALGGIVRQVERNSLDEELKNYAQMLQVAFVGFFVSAFFVNATFIDISWNLVGLTIALEHITQKSMNEKEEYER